VHVPGSYKRIERILGPLLEILLCRGFLFFCLAFLFCLHLDDGAPWTTSFLAYLADLKLHRAHNTAFDIQPCISPAVIDKSLTTV